MYWTSSDLERTRYSVDELHELYMLTVDKSEYPDFFWWVWDMERSAVLFRHDVTSHICTLPQHEQDGIMAALLLAGIEGNDLELAMNGRICDLEDTINIEEWR